MKHNDSHQREGEIMTRTGNTKMRALTEALKLLQEVGYNGFSFQHVADALQIKKQSLFVHFKTKEDLGKSLIEYHRQRFAAWAETMTFFHQMHKLAQCLNFIINFSLIHKNYAHYQR